MRTLNSFIKEGILNSKVDLDLSGVIQDEFAASEAVWDDLNFSLDKDVLYLSTGNGDDYYCPDFGKKQIQLLKKYGIKEIRLTDEYINFRVYVDSTTPGFAITGESRENSIDFRGPRGARPTIVEGWNLAASAFDMMYAGHLTVKDCTFISNGYKNGSDTIFFTDCASLPQMENVRFEGIKALYFSFTAGKNQKKIVEDFARNLGLDIKSNTSKDISDKTFCSAWQAAKALTGVKTINFEAEGVHMECTKNSGKWKVFFRRI